MIGVDDHPQNLGLIPCAIAWLFKLINEQKEKTGARFSVRVSAVEVTGKNEQLKDLLSDVAHGGCKHRIFLYAIAFFSPFVMGSVILPPQWPFTLTVMVQMCVPKGKSMNELFVQRHVLGNHNLH